MEFDITKFEVVETATMQVNDVFGEPMKFNGELVTIELCGPGSADFVAINAKLERENQTRVFAEMRGKKNNEPAASSLAQSARKLVSCTRVINNFPIPGGAEALYSNPALGYIREQAAKFIEDWANFPNQFMKRSASE